MHTYPAANETTALARDIGELPYVGKLATTEPGTLPYYSNWETLDLTGANTPEIALNGFNYGDITAFDPDLVFIRNATPGTSPQARLTLETIASETSTKEYEAYRLGNYRLWLMRDSEAYADLRMLVRKRGFEPMP